VRIGALLIVKIDWTVQVIQLTAVQQATLDHRPQLSSSPQEIVPALNLPDGSRRAPDGSAIWEELPEPRPGLRPAPQGREAARTRMPGAASAAGSRQRRATGGFYEFLPSGIGPLVSRLRIRYPVQRADQSRTFFSETRAVAMDLPVGLPGTGWRAVVSGIFARRKACCPGQPRRRAISGETTDRYG
jgi:hypothetical protein